MRPGPRVSGPISTGAHHTRSVSSTYIKYSHTLLASLPHIYYLLLSLIDLLLLKNMTYLSNILHVAPVPVPVAVAVAVAVVVGDV